MQQKSYIFKTMLSIPRGCYLYLYFINTFHYFYSIYELWRFSIYFHHSSFFVYLWNSDHVKLHVFGVIININKFSKPDYVKLIKDNKGFVYWLKACLPNFQGFLSIKENSAWQELKFSTIQVNFSNWQSIYHFAKNHARFEQFECFDILRRNNLRGCETLHYVLLEHIFILIPSKRLNL